MKSLVNVMGAVLIFSMPIACFAQATKPLTRAEVQTQLVELEKAGYQPGVYDPKYPANIQAAQARVDAKTLSAQAESSEMGSVVSGSSAVGEHVSSSEAAAVSMHSGLLSQ
jgi:hypothetical protein